MSLPWFQQYLIERVAVACDERDVTRREVAARVGISQKHLSQIMTGAAWPTAGIWTSIFDALGMKPPL